MNTAVAHRRTLATLVRTPFQARHYTALANILSASPSPVAFLSRYLGLAKDYPARIALRTPTGPLSLTVYSQHDIQTINEIFFRLDYPADASDRVVVDFGSNIGISGAWFLTRAADVRVYLHEPLPQNIERLKHNLAPFLDRVVLAEAAVGPRAGTVRFGWEESGRYGGIERDTGRFIEVPCLDSNAALETVLARHERIDILKVDTETLEHQLVQRIPPGMAARIRRMIVEGPPFAANPFPASHEMTRRGYVTTLSLLAGR
jgi:FkbM family methyltransferase